ncbi:heparinase II/III family protein [Aliarcobacter cryaerophilus]|uniref:heparinase II/III family protein n=1 Tax=Aliarcobacter cryaerophilus TaxID=28198 RepID=UPI00082D3D45|nr:heparinase II/III family protein [Aliarcobacter cryaerophilus]
MSLLNKVKPIYEYIKLMGLDWFIFRVKYELLKKINYFDKINEKILKKVSSCDKSKFYYKKTGLVNKDFIGDSSFVEKADNARKGKVFAFSNEYFNYNEDGAINWQMNPISKVKANSALSWNRLPDFGEYGDIKLIWEASRFPQVYYFINAYTTTKDTNYSNICVSQIIDWIDKNPYPQGVNYKCGQEISFRTFAWIIALEYFEDFVNKEDEEKIVQNIYSSLLRVDANIDYAAKSVKNNHSISEAAGLFIGGLLFPQFKESKYFVDKGLKYLLKETSYQVYNDGSYIQHSFTYQRLALDVLSFIIIVAKKLNFELPIEIRQRHQKMIEFLNSFVQENGWLPNYGSNDGANLFLLTGNDYRDFRSSLNFASVVNSGYSLFEGHKKLVEFFSLEDKGLKEVEKKIEFSDGGYYILKNKNLFSFIRCHSYKDRPASNDMFHLDIWSGGKNIFCDAGSYSYNTDKKFKNNFIGVIGHNTVMINDSNQMAQVLNFGYSNWTKAKCIGFSKNHFVGENYAYKKEFEIVHQRDLKLEDDKIIIIDNIKNIKENTNIKQIWNTKFEVEVIDEYTLKVDEFIISSNIKHTLEVSYISDYYNSYVEGTRIVFETDISENFEIKTLIEKRD